MARFHDRIRSVPAYNLAEILCDLGQVLRRRMQRGPGNQAAWAHVPSLQAYRQLALAFVNLSGAVQLRAMVEDWPLPRIKQVLRAQLIEAGRR